MSADIHFLTAAPLAFVLILPLFFYYALRSILASPSCPPPLEYRIPEYLINQHVDKTKSVRRHSAHPSRHKSIKPERTSNSHRKSKQGLTLRRTLYRPLQVLGTCSAGLLQFSLINQSFGKNEIGNIGRTRTVHQLFEPTNLTTILEDVSY